MMEPHAYMPCVRIGLIYRCLMWVGIGLHLFSTRYRKPLIPDVFDMDCFMCGMKMILSSKKTPKYLADIH